MQARPRGAVVLTITIPVLVVMASVAAFANVLDYNISCSPILGCLYLPPSGCTACGGPTYDMNASQYLANMSSEFTTKVNKISGYGSGSERIAVEDSELLLVCNRSYNPKCLDQNSNIGINTQYVGLIALHGASLPISTPNSPTFIQSFSNYQKNNNIGGAGDCDPQVFGTMYLGLPNLKFHMMLSCDSMDVASDLPSGSNQQNGWLQNVWGVHILAGFSGENHTNSNTTTMDDFITDQKSQGIGHAWMNHFTYFSPTGNNTTVGASDCAVPMLLGTSQADLAKRWNETINSPNAMSNPYPIGAWYNGYYCGCCADYGNGQHPHCTPSC